MQNSQPLYRQLAVYYDAIYGFKDYAAEAKRVEDLIRRFGPENGRSLLDIGCGTGHHLRYWRRHFDCVGLDSSPAMLRMARGRLPGVRFVLGKMQTFALGRKFDAITCMFSAIGYVKDLRDLRATIRNFGAHLNPGGVVVVEPWLEPKDYAAGHPSLLVYETRNLKIARASYSHLRGKQSEIEMQYLVVRRGKGIQHFSESHRCPLFDRKQMLAAFRAEGLHPNFFARGFSSGRGLYVATSPYKRLVKSRSGR